MSLGCGQNTVILTRRGGGQTITEYADEQLSYNRQLSESGSAEVRLPACGPVRPRSWEHELAVYRDGDLAWVGPVTEMETEEDGLTVQARDLFAWMQRRLLPRNRDFKDVDLSTIFRTLVEDALSRDPSPNLILSVSASGVTGDRTILRSEHRVAADELRELARSAVDWTMVGRVLYASKPPRRFMLQDEHLIGPKLQVRGLDVASEVTVLGNQPTGVEATATSPIFRTGLLETVASEPGILDVKSAAVNAAGRLELLRDELLVLDTGLTPDAPVAFNDLVPGALVAVSATIGDVEVDETMRLLSVAVEDGVDGEQVSVTLTSVGAPE